MELETDKINRQVHFMWAQAYDPQDSSGDNNTWRNHRAPEGYKFVLDSAQVSVASGSTKFDGIWAIIDGDYRTHWNLYPGVENRDFLARMETSEYQLDHIMPLNGWECKEYTLCIRSNDESNDYKACTIVWYYLRKMTWREKLHYGVIQPKNRLSRALGQAIQYGVDDG